MKHYDDDNEVITEKEFSKELSKHNIESLSFFEYENLKTNEILLEYIENSKTL